MKFGEYIRHLREERGLTQADLAERASMKIPYLSKIELEKVAPPSEEILTRLSVALEVDTYEMILKAGKIPQDFIELILTNREVFNYLKKLVEKKNR